MLLNMTWEFQCTSVSVYSVFEITGIKRVLQRNHPLASEETMSFPEKESALQD